MPSTHQLEAALADLRSQEGPDIPGTARKYDCHESTLRRRYNGQSTSRDDISNTFHAALTKAQERALVDLINKLTNRGLPPTPRIVRNLAEEIRGKRVGKNWTSGFVKRHTTELKSLYLRCIDNKRFKSEYVPAFKLFYNLLEQTIEDHQITANNIYNVDEKGFLIRIRSAIKRIITKTAHEAGQVRQAAQDGSREFITLIACVSATGEAIPPTLLYKSESGDLQDTWLEDVQYRQEAFFGGSTNGWSSNQYGLKWLTDVFEPSTKPASPRIWRLLIVDGHSSHVNLEFLQEANKRRIIILILPPHTTHRLQPLDVVLFLPLATAYQVNMDAWLHRSLGLTSFSKRFFWKIFWPAWQSTFGTNKELIQRGFEKPGIWPVDRSKVLPTINHQRPATPTLPNEIEGQDILPLAAKTPLTSKAIRRIQREYTLNPTPSKLNLLFKSQQKLAAQHEIDTHIQKGLFETIKEEKQRRKRGKRLNLVGKQAGSAELWDTAKIKRAQELIDAKVAQNIQEKEDKVARKTQLQLDKLGKAIKAHEDRIQKVKIARERYILNEAELEVKALVKQVPKKSKIVVLRLKKPSKVPLRAVRFAEPIQVVKEEEGVVRHSSCGRIISLPDRYKK